MHVSHVSVGPCRALCQGLSQALAAVAAAECRAMDEVDLDMFSSYFTRVYPLRALPDAFGRQIFEGNA